MNDDNKNKRNRLLNQKNNWLLYTIAGLVISISIVVFAIPSLSNSNVWPGSSKTPPDESANPEVKDESVRHENSDNPAPKAQNMKVNVSTQLTEVVDSVTPAVVGVNNIQQNEDYWEMEEEEEDGELYTGSGVIYEHGDGNAYVITNHHVVEGADDLEVVLFDETTKDAELLGSDIFSDLAVLQIDDEGVESTIERGSSGNVKVGEPAITVGNPLGQEFASSITQGVISGKERTIPQDIDQDGRADWQAEVLQTDAAINPGNSGGALINIDGQLIGINSMKINEEAVEGIGFAIPVDTAWPIVEEIEQTGKVTRPFLGLESYSLDEVPQGERQETFNLPNEVEGGVYVWSVESRSPATEAGIERLDVITALDGKEVMDMIDLRKILYQEKEVGDTVDVTYYRDGQEDETTIKLGEQDEGNPGLAE